MPKAPDTKKEGNIWIDGIITMDPEAQGTGKKIDIKPYADKEVANNFKILYISYTAL